jgi:CRP-like cAMP-binding protein
MLEEYGPGEVVVPVGEMGAKIYMILSGEVAIYI